MVIGGLRNLFFVSLVPACLTRKGLAKPRQWTRTSKVQPPSHDHGQSGISSDFARDSDLNIPSRHLGIKGTRTSVTMHLDSMDTSVLAGMQHGHWYE